MSYVSTKYTGVQYRVNQDGTKTFYIRYKVNGKLYREKVGTDKEGITAAYCNKHRAKKTSEIRLGDVAPYAQKEEEKRVKSLTVKACADAYLDSIKELSDYKNTVGRYDNHLHKEFGAKLLTEITKNDVEKFVAKKRKETSFKTGRPYATKTINDMVDLLNVIFNHAIATEKLKIKSPAKAKTKKEKNSSDGIKRLNVDNARQRYLDKDEIKKLYDAVDKREGREDLTEDLKIFVRVALSTGARLSSVLNIRKQDINLTNRTVIIKDLKNKSTYIGYLSDNAISVIQARYEDLTPTQYLIGCGTTPKDRTGISKVLQPILDKLFNQGLAVEDAQNRVVIHTLRHTFGSLLAINGTPIFTIQKLMNHQSIDMTIRYAKLAPEQGKDAVISMGF